MTNYSRGAGFERRVAALLVADGYVVYRSAGSHGHADLVALKTGQTLLVQCKTDGRVDPGEWNGLYAEAQRVSALAIVACRPTPRSLAYRRIVGPKSGVRGARAPWQPWSPKEVTA